MRELWDFTLRHGDVLLAAVVFLEQIGLPLPAMPVLLVTGALAGLGIAHFGKSLLVAVIAAVAADYIWYELGRSKGDRILGFLCRLSLEPDTCVRKTSESFDRWGAFTLLFAKYVPGLSTVAPPLAGSARIHRLRFLWCDTMGSVLWAGPVMGLGYVFRHQAEVAMAGVSQVGTGVLFVMLAGLGVWLWRKWRERQRVLARLTLPRIQANDLDEKLRGPEPPIVFDLRPEREVRRSGGRIPTARQLRASQAELHLRDLPRGSHLVFYCS